MQNYRPVSNLSMASKLLEKVVASILKDHLQVHDLSEKMQSAYKPNHSTETALVRVQNDILWALNQRKIVILILLDMSAAFDTVNHSILLDRLQHDFGVTGKALSWFQSYLSNRTYSVAINGTQSNAITLDCGVPQGSVLGPILFNVYTNQLGSIARENGATYHGYAYDTQLYAAFTLNDMSNSIVQTEVCVNTVRSWILNNNLMINDDKTELIILGSKHHVQQTEPFTFHIGNSSIEPAQKVKNIGAIFDQYMTMTDHINNLARSANYHLKRISKTRKYLTQDAASKLIHAFVSSRLDYANALLGGVPACHLQKLQKIQNTAARILALVPRRQHIQPILRELHWLPVAQRITYKIVLLSFKALTGTAPAYLSELLEWYTPTRTLRSASKHQLVIPHAQLAHGRRAFCCIAPTLWNELPEDLRAATKLTSFKTGLKTYLFGLAYPMRL